MNKKMRWLYALMLLVLALPAFPASPSAAQGDSRTFPETGKTVKGKFLQYWNTHGALAQQGFPISEELQEVSDTDGKTYTMQYFERAIFEAHPEKQPPYDVLLSLLGTFLYQKKYPSGAPNQTVNADLKFRDFPETNHRVGGIFLDYWNNNGGLAQQGFPISDEFTEVNQLDGKPYKVQYFERAVFEYHPEIQDPRYKVLLSQLGTFRYKEKHGGGPGPGPNPTPVPGQPTPTPRPVQPTPTPPKPSCDASGNIKGIVTVNGQATTNAHAKTGDTIVFEAIGFQAGEDVSFWFTLPNGVVLGTPSPVPGGADPDGHVRFNPLTITSDFTTFEGRWALTVQGATSNNQSIIYFCLSK